MATHRARAGSPSAPRIYVDAVPRASTGTILTSSYDTRFDQRSNRASFSTIPSTQTASRNNAGYETQPVSKRTYVDPAHSGGTISRTEYAVRPRRDSNSAENRRPLSLMTKNPSPTRDLYDSPRDIVPYAKPSRDDSTRLRPSHTQGSGHHQRHNSATRAETPRYSLGPEPFRADREYHKRGPYVEKVADSRPPAPVARYGQEPNYEYTGPREQFDRDYPAPRPRRASLTRRERPTSAIGTKFDQVPFRRDTAPPPSASRQLQRIERDDRKSGFESDPERSREVHARERPSRHSMKGPILHQRDDGYSSARDDYDSRRSTRRPHDEDVAIAGSKSHYHDANRDIERERERPRREREREEERPREPPRDRDRDRERRERRSSRTGERDYERERERHRPRDYEVIEDEPYRKPRRREPRDTRDESPERSSGLKTLATAAFGGLAAAGIANVKPRKDKDEEASETDDRKERKHRRHKSRERKEDDGREDETAEEPRRRRRESRTRKEDSSGSDTPDDRKRPQSRTRRRRGTQDGYGSDREKAQAALAAPSTDRRPSRDPDPNAVRGEQAREPIPDRSQQESPTNNEGRTLSPGEGEDNRPRKVSIVEPNKKEEIKPKGILKKPRDVPFPEDPNPTREGVAPLKQAGKDGVPAGARWTKVSRILVNPEALERANERFEERDDYVIILRVVSRQEIEKLAEKTKEIRGNTILPYIRDQDHSTDYSPQKLENVNGRNRSRSVSVVEPSEATATPKTKMITMTPSRDGLNL